jgi:DNA replication protein DnaC
LGKKWISIIPEEKEMILTEKEKDEAINHAIEAAKKHLVWKMWDKGESAENIENKIKSIDWKKEISSDEVLRIANENKHTGIEIKVKLKQLEEQEKKNYEELKKECNANYFFKVMAEGSRNYGKKLIQNEFNKPLIKAICFFLSEDPRFETELNYSLKKGLLIRGVSGIGKTYLVTCVKDNKFKPISIYSMIDISDEVREYGGFQTKGKVVYLDDVGSEETVNHYGSKINWFKEFLESYYLNSTDFSRLILSTNCNFDQIQEKYGFRVRSRMKEMFNIIDVKGKDLRK